jgi:hypothetical integral membrane protein (TIGR02206 family)
MVAALGAYVLGVDVRERFGNRTRAISVALGSVLIANEALYFLGIGVAGLASGTWSVRQGLPLNLCDVTPFIAGSTLIRPRRLLVELTYFWALAGTVQGLLTPDVARAFASYDYFQYYIAHVGVVLAAIFVVAQGYRPREGAIGRVVAASLLLVVAVGAVDAVTGANYMNLRIKTPPGTTALDWLSPWPWYIVECIGMAWIFFVILDTPFRRRRRATVAEPIPTPIAEPVSA